MLLKSSNFKSKPSRTKENTNKIILIMTSLLTPWFLLHFQSCQPAQLCTSVLFLTLEVYISPYKSTEKCGGEILIRVPFAALAAALIEQEAVVRSLKMVKREGV